MSSAKSVILFAGYSLEPLQIYTHDKKVFFYIKRDFRSYLTKKHTVTSEYQCVWKGLTFVEIQIPKIENYTPLNRQEQCK